MGHISLPMGLTITKFKNPKKKTKYFDLEYMAMGLVVKGKKSTWT